MMGRKYINLKRYEILIAFMPHLQTPCSNASKMWPPSDMLESWCIGYAFTKESGAAEIREVLRLRNSFLLYAIENRRNTRINYVWFFL